MITAVFSDVKLEENANKDTENAVSDTHKYVLIYIIFQLIIQLTLIKNVFQVKLSKVYFQCYVKAPMIPTFFVKLKAVYTKARLAK